MGEKAVFDQGFGFCEWFDLGGVLCLWLVGGTLMEDFFSGVGMEKGRGIFECVLNEVRLYCARLVVKELQIQIASNGFCFL